ncbi:unnamed protein product [Penicillium pancosmium]
MACGDVTFQYRRDDKISATNSDSGAACALIHQAASHLASEILEPAGQEQQSSEPTPLSPRDMEIKMPSKTEKDDEPLEQNELGAGYPNPKEYDRALSIPETTGNTTCRDLESVSN